MTDFYVEGHTAEGAPYGPVHVLTTPIVEQGSLDELLKLLKDFDALRESREEAEQAREDAWWEAVMRSKAKDAYVQSSE